MKTLIVLTAPPGSGKSTWAKKYAESHENTKIISSDGLRLELLGDYQNFTNEKLIWKTFEERCHIYAKEDNVTVIMDALCDTNELRMSYCKEYPEYDKRVLVYIKKDKNDILENNKKREPNKIVCDSAMDYLLGKFEEPSEEVKSAFDEVIVVDYYF